MHFMSRGTEELDQLKERDQVIRNSFELAEKSFISFDNEMKVIRELHNTLGLGLMKLQIEHLILTFDVENYRILHGKDLDTDKGKEKDKKNEYEDSIFQPFYDGVMNIPLATDLNALKVCYNILKTVKDQYRGGKEEPLIEAKMQAIQKTAALIEEQSHLRKPKNK